MTTLRQRARLRSLAAVPALAVAALLGPAAAACAAHPATTSGHPANAAAAGHICESALPAQADDTLALIARGGPFPHRQDGEVFQNREHVLPSEPHGYYHEYTVVTPGSPTRGARRVVTAASGVDYYTADHYASFAAIDFGC